MRLQWQFLQRRAERNGVHVSEGRPISGSQSAPVSMSVCQQPPWAWTDGLVRTGSTVARHTSSCAKWPLINCTLLTELDLFALQTHGLRKRPNSLSSAIPDGRHNVSFCPRLSFHYSVLTCECLEENESVIRMIIIDSVNRQEQVLM